MRNCLKIKCKKDSGCNSRVWRLPNMSKALGSVSGQKQNAVAVRAQRNSVEEKDNEEEDCSCSRGSVPEMNRAHEQPRRGEGRKAEEEESVTAALCDSSTTPPTVKDVVTGRMPWTQAHMMQIPICQGREASPESWGDFLSVPGQGPMSLCFSAKPRPAHKALRINAVSGCVCKSVWG